MAFMHSESLEKYIYVFDIVRNPLCKSCSALGTAGEVLLCMSACTVKLFNFSFLHTDKYVTKTNSSAFIGLID